MINDKFLVELLVDAVKTNEKSKLSASNYDSDALKSI